MNKGNFSPDIRYNSPLHIFISSLILGHSTGEFQAIWEAAIDGIVVAIGASQPRKMEEIRQAQKYTRALSLKLDSCRT